MPAELCAEIVKHRSGLDLVAALDQFHLKPPLRIRGDLLVEELVSFQILVREIIPPMTILLIMLGAAQRTTIHGYNRMPCR